MKLANPSQWKGQNKFSLKGSYVTLGGKPDLIGLNSSGIICDVKTGQPKPSDHVQIMIYILVWRAE